MKIIKMYCAPDQKYLEMEKDSIGYMGTILTMLIFVQFNFDHVQTVAQYLF